MGRVVGLRGAAGRLIRRPPPPAARSRAAAARRRPSGPPAGVVAQHPPETLGPGAAHGAALRCPPSLITAATISALSFCLSMPSTPPDLKRNTCGGGGQTIGQAMATPSHNRRAAAAPDLVGQLQLEVLLLLLLVRHDRSATIASMRVWVTGAGLLRRVVIGVLLERSVAASGAAAYAGPAGPHDEKRGGQAARRRGKEGGGDRGRGVQVQVLQGQLTHTQIHMPSLPPVLHAVHAAAHLRRRPSPTQQRPRLARTCCTTAASGQPMRTGARSLGKLLSKNLDGDGGGRTCTAATY
jgi:hypothetical protein